ncbi:MAG TPA: hypothetical protein VMT87_06595 [Vicinamibacteria bacterium]|nr:hypothetical protein [Vicinamibacteria bacterium]
MPRVPACAAAAPQARPTRLRHLRAPVEGGTVRGDDIPVPTE